MPYVKIYGFGSYFNAKENHNDIDLLIVHNSLAKESIRLAIKSKKFLQASHPSSDMDITILSEQEEKTVDFIAKSQAKFLFGLDAMNFDLQVEDLKRLILI